MDKDQNSLRKGSGMLRAWLKSTPHLPVRGSSPVPAFPCATSAMETTQRAVWQEGQLGQGHRLMLESVKHAGLEQSG